MASAANVYYVPQSGSSPYDWSVIGNWFTDTAGTTPLGALPGSTETVVLTAAACNGKEYQIPSGVTANLYGFQFGSENATVKVRVDDGATLKFGHSSYLGYKGSSNEVRVASGGTFTTASYTVIGYTGSSTAYYGSHLLVDEGGTYNQKGSALAIGDGNKGDAYVENHGTMNLDSWLFAGAYGDSAQYFTNKASNSSSPIKGYLHNYGTFTTTDHSSKQIVLGACRYGRGYFYNYADATATIMLPMYVGSGTNAIGYVYNAGTMTSSRLVYLGGRSAADSSTISSSSSYPYGYLYNQPGGKLTFGSDFRIGTVRYGRGLLDIEEDSEATFNGNVVIGYSRYSQGTVNLHSGGTLTTTNSFKLGYYGYGKMIVHGKFYPKGPTPFLIGANTHTWASNKGELEVSVNGRFYGDKNGIDVAATVDGTEGHVLLANSAKIESPGIINMATGTASIASFTIAGSSILQSPSQIRVGCGGASAISTLDAKLVMSNNASITSMYGNLYIAPGPNSRGEVTVADNASISFSNAAKHDFNIANVSDAVDATGTLRLRGGSITMTTGSVMRVGYNSTTRSACNGFITGWGRVNRHLPDETDYWKGITLIMYCGAITADGEGEARDLDLSMIRKVNNGGGNASGTNGWYAVNGGRLTYPCRNTDYVVLGDYYDMTDDPVYVNSVNFAFDSGKSGYLIGQLYATDRTDIPAGLPADDLAKKTLRLGVWRATVNQTYNATNIVSGTVSSAAIKVRYNNFILDQLKDGNGDFDAGQRVAIYSHDGSANGSWRKVASLSADAAEEAGHLVGGTILASSEPWNLGFFAVVAEPKKGTSILLR